MPKSVLSCVRGYSVSSQVSSSPRAEGVRIMYQHGAGRQAGCWPAASPARAGLGARGRHPLCACQKRGLRVLAPAARGAQFRALRLVFIKSVVLGSRRAAIDGVQTPPRYAYPRSPPTTFSARSNGRLLCVWRLYLLEVPCLLQHCSHRTRTPAPLACIAAPGAVHGPNEIHACGGRAAIRPRDMYRTLCARAAACRGACCPSAKPAHPLRARVARPLGRMRGRPKGRARRVRPGGEHEIVLTRAQWGKRRVTSAACSATKHALLVHP